MPASFGTHLRALRKEMGLTLRQTASRLGYANHGYLGDVERGEKRPSIDLLARIADRLEGGTMIAVIDGLGGTKAGTDSSALPLIDRSPSASELELFRLIMSALQLSGTSDSSWKGYTSRHLERALASFLGAAPLPPDHDGFGDLVYVHSDGSRCVIECKQTNRSPGDEALMPSSTTRLGFSVSAHELEVINRRREDDARHFGRRLTTALTDALRESQQIQLTLVSPLDSADSDQTYRLHRTSVSPSVLANAAWHWEAPVGDVKVLVGQLGDDRLCEWVIADETVTFRSPALTGEVVAEWVLEPLPQALRSGLAGQTVFLFSEQVKAIARF